MDERLQSLIEQIPEKPPRSKLEKHHDVIRELRRKGRTYQEIAAFFREHLGVTVAASTIHAFVRVRARRRKPIPQVELPPSVVATAESPRAAVQSDVRERIEALKRKRPPEPPPEPIFKYNENEPLHLISAKGQGGKTG